MKKLSILFLLSVFLFSSCEAVTSFINYFVDIESNQTTGTENTEFTFKANTNDLLSSWSIDGVIIPLDYTRSTTNELIYSFSSGSHTVEVLTENGAIDSVEIIVSPVETVFSLSAITGESTTEIYLDFPLLAIDGVEHNLDDMITYSTEEQNIINLPIVVDQTDSFCFVNNNALEVYEIDLQAVTIAQLRFLIEIWYPERLEEPEPVIPHYTETRFHLSGHGGLASDQLTVHEESLQVGIDHQVYTDNAVYLDDIRKIVLNMNIDNSDSFLFVNGNMFNFFEISFDDMSYGELIIACDILNRYPEETIQDLWEDY